MSMMSNDERLAYMADQIARNFVALGHDAAVAATADHIASFWDPRMKAKGFELLRGDSVFLSPLAAAALRLLDGRDAPPHQTRATQTAIPGGSDAG